MIAEGARSAGLKVVCVGIKGSVEPELADEVDVFYRVAVARMGGWIRRLRKHGVSRTIMVGKVAKQNMFAPWRIIQYIPDWRVLRIYYWRLRNTNRLTDTLLDAVADELASGGIVLEDSTVYCKEHLATEGVLTGSAPKGAFREDIEWGWELVKKLASMGIGQAIIVKEREVVAVEALEGTAEMIKRAGSLCRKGKWTLLKAAKPDQDMRMDVPCIGPDTIRSLAENRGKCVVVESGKSIIIDKPETLALAKKLGITVVGR